MDNNTKQKKLDELQGKVNLIFGSLDCMKVFDKAMGMDSLKIIDDITKSGLRGRGGAGIFYRAQMERSCRSKR